ncbi:MAG TPA: GrpB family protein [Candidatus Sulfotelmatobacter sp.]|nr:GrpB family protein [Candidatus Sulfotelmatobacter sp.]
MEQRVKRVLKEEIEIVPYNPGWPELFREEKEHLLNVLPKDLIQRIEHFGSTAVPELAAKPIVDMLVQVTDLGATRERIAPILEAEGYDYFWRPTSAEDVPPFYAWFIKRDQPGGVRTHHIHMISGSPEFATHWDALLFRDYLIDHPEVAGEYEQLKRKLAEVYRNDREAYTGGKAEFVSRIMKEAKRLRR